MSRHVAAALLALALLFGACGEKEPETSSGGAPAVTSGEAYELGGADGSGADGEEADAPRGGIGAGPDTKEPGDDEDGDDDTSVEDR
jgi:hypothetical protein